VVKRWAKRKYEWMEGRWGRQWTFQQDGAPSHRDRTTQAWLRMNCPDFITKDQWPAASCDLSPLDYSIWGILKDRVGEQAYESVTALKDAIRREWFALDQDVIDRAVDDWPRRLSAVIEADGGHFE
jgi:hypothetical protein